MSCREEKYSPKYIHVLYQCSRSGDFSVSNDTALKNLKMFRLLMVLLAIVRVKVNVSQDCPSRTP